jgi:hypothetical protein
MQKSMSIMEKGMTQIQQGFLNNIKLIQNGAKLVKIVKKIINYFQKKIISQYLPKDKKYMINIAENTSKRIDFNINVLELTLDNKAYINTTNTYSNTCTATLLLEVVNKLKAYMLININLIIIYTIFS